MEEMIWVLIIYNTNGRGKMLSLHRTKAGAEAYANNKIKELEIEEASWSIYELPVFEN